MCMYQVWSLHQVLNPNGEVLGVDSRYDHDKFYTRHVVMTRYFKKNDRHRYIHVLSSCKSLKILLNGNNTVGSCISHVNR